MAGIGWSYLVIRYRNLSKVKSICRDEFNGDYGSAGTIYILNFIAILGAVGLTGFLLVIIGTIIWRFLTGTD